MPSPASAAAATAAGPCRCVCPPQDEGPPLLVSKGAVQEMLPLCSHAERGDERLQLTPRCEKACSRELGN